MNKLKAYTEELINKENEYIKQIADSEKKINEQNTAIDELKLENKVKKKKISKLKSDIENYENNSQTKNKHIDSKIKNLEKVLE